MSQSRPPIPLNTQVRAEAVEWLLRFSEGEVDAPARETFSQWLRASPEHVHAYLRVSAFWQEAEHIDGKEAPRDIASLIAQARREANVFPLELGSYPSVREVTGRPVSPKPLRQRRRFVLAAAASLLLMIGTGAVSWYIGHAGATYSTEIGEQRIVNLPDGSTVTINANSSIKVAYSDVAREIELRDGQALFKVAKNPARPFIVRSGTTSIRAVGTQFDVYKKKAGTVVTVVEGQVSVDTQASPRAFALGDRNEGESDYRSRAQEAEIHTGRKREGVLLVAGEQLKVSTNGDESQLIPKPVALTQATAWTSGLLVFDGAPLGEVIQEFNRQNSKPLLLNGLGLSELRISGTFPASGSDRIVHFLQERFHVVVRETDEEIQISKP